MITVVRNPETGSYKALSIKDNRTSMWVATIEEAIKGANDYYDYVDNIPKALNDEYEWIIPPSCIRKKEKKVKLILYDPKDNMYMQIKSETECSLWFPEIKSAVECSSYRVGKSFIKIMINKYQKVGAIRKRKCTQKNKF